MDNSKFIDTNTKFYGSIVPEAIGSDNTNIVTNIVYSKECSIDKFIGNRNAIIDITNPKFKIIIFLVRITAFIIYFKDLRKLIRGNQNSLSTKDKTLLK